MIILYYLAESN